MSLKAGASEGKLAPWGHHEGLGDCHKIISTSHRIAVIRQEIDNLNHGYAHTYWSFMLRNTVLALFCISGVAGCGVSFPQTTGELKSMASSSPLVAAESYAVSRSTTAVVASLRAL